MNKKWTIAEENYLKDYVGVFTDEELAKKLSEATGKHVTMLAVRKKRQKMGLKKQRGRGFCRLENERYINDALDNI